MSKSPPPCLSGRGFAIYFSKKAQEKQGFTAKPLLFFFYPNYNLIFSGRDPWAAPPSFSCRWQRACRRSPAAPPRACRCIADPRRAETAAECSAQSPAAPSRDKWGNRWSRPRLRYATHTLCARAWLQSRSWLRWCPRTLVAYSAWAERWEWAREPTLQCLILQSLIR